MPADLASRLGHNLTSVPCKAIETAGGIAKAYPHTICIEVLGILGNGHENRDEVLFTIQDTLMDFAEGLPVILLGRKCFLDLFNVSIRYPERRFSIRKPAPPGQKKVKKRRR